MLRFLLRRFLWFGITIMTVMTVSFFLMHSVKGGPFDGERKLDPVIEANIKARYHLDWPLWRQYLHYVGPFNLDDNRALFAEDSDGDLQPWRSSNPAGQEVKAFGGVFAGDFGPSFRYKDFTVNEILAESLPISMLLGTLSMMFALALGISAGIASALRPGSGIDLSLRLAATAGIALPNFVIASFLIILFVFMIPLLPVAGWGTIQHMLLPGFCLGLVFAAYIARLTRTGMLETLSADYIRTAHAKGLSPRTVVLRHALKGGLLPVVSYLGPATAGILTGSLVIEKIFFIPGTGSHFINAATNRDYTLAMGVTILFTVLVYTLNTLVDMAYTLLDPRISLEDE
ncbi:Oligopeptide transport system permease protein OppB [Planctomycetes bacterium Poly30]|uniref:Oligopeptide transport system permease protein OppB n=1 Tax=Saltatorellus ferox TaxID=2528018 RepID=A0A518EVZ7_9BACT|nr:Oligopeptide transport system permease protein OppB [Planctomycetes bacterium Poly30]